MKKARLALILVWLVLIMTSLGFVAICARPATAQAPHEQVLLKVLAAKFGGGGYFFNFALADTITKIHPWLRASAVATRASVENIKIHAAGNYEDKKKMLVWATSNTVFLARSGKAPFTTKEAETAKRLRVLAKAKWDAHAFISNKPKIKTVEDLKGKKIALPGKGSGSAEIGKGIVKYAWGIWDDVKVEYLGWDDGIKAMEDGLVDICQVPFGSVGAIKDNKWMIAVEPAIRMVQTGTKVNWIGVDAEGVERYNKGMGAKQGCIIVPAGSVGSGQPKADLPCLEDACVWWVDKDMDDEVVTEVCKILYEQTKLLHSYSHHCKALIPEDQARVVTADEFHHAALKFYKEKGVIIGMKP